MVLYYKVLTLTGKKVLTLTGKKVLTLTGKNSSEETFNKNQ